MYCRLTALISISVLAGCAGSLDTPSLAIRPAETAGAIEAARPPLAGAPTPVATVQPLSKAIIGRIEASVAAARASQAPFAKALDPARATVASATGAAAGSDAWVVAQVAISRLERTREPVTNALSDIDAVRRELVTSGIGFDRNAFAVLHSEADEIDLEQQSVVTALLRRLKTL